MVSLFRCVDQGPGFCGGGCPVYHWFKTRDAMVAFLKDYAADLIVSDNADRDALATRVAAIFADQTQAFNGDALPAALNAVLKEFIVFEWIGAFVELVTGSDDELIGVRQAFRDDRNEIKREVSGVAPIMRQEMADFRRFLAEV